jgi:hypothetical protein
MREGHRIDVVRKCEDTYKLPNKNMKHTAIF